MSGASPKICVYCRNDCSSVPHVVNRRGAYCCRACVPASNIPATTTETIGVVPIEPPNLSGKTRAPCPKCGSTTTVGVPQCAVCGYAPPNDPGSPELPRPKRMRRMKSPRCRQCDYPLKGLKGDTCPECGTSFMQFTRREADEQVSEEVAKAAYRHAITIGLIGLVIGAAVPLAMGRWKDALLFPVAWIISSATGYAAAFTGCLLWIGFTSSLPLMAVQIFAIHAASLAAVSMTTAVVPLGMSSLIVGGLIYIYLMSELLEMDPFDARCIGGICMAIHWTAALLARFYGLI